MSVILTFIFFLLCFSCGWTLTTWFHIKAGLEKIGTSMLLGLWLVTLFMMFAYQITGVFSRELTLGVAAGLSAVFLMMMGTAQRQALKVEVFFLITNFKKIITNFQLRWRTLNRLESLLIVIVILILGVTLLSNLTWPVSDWDAIALYDFRAIMITKVGQWVDGAKLGYFYHYPPFTSLAHAAVYLMGSERVKIVYSVLFVSFLATFYALLRQQTQRFQAIFGTFLIAISPLLADHITVSYTNLPYTVYFCTGIFYTWRWFSKQQDSDMKLAFLFTAAACWVRASEPFWIIAFVLIFAGRVFLVKNVKWLTVLLFGVLTFGLIRYWPEYVNTLHLPPPPPVSSQARLLDAINPTTLVSHAVAVAFYLTKNAIVPLFYLVLPTVIVALWDKKLKRTAFFKAALTSIVLLVGSVVAGTYFFSFTYNTWDEIGPSLTRVMMAIVPLLIYFVSASGLWEVILKYVTFPAIHFRKPKTR